MKVIGHDSGLPQGSTGSFPKTSLDTVAVLYVNYSAQHREKKSQSKCGNGRVLKQRWPGLLQGRSLYKKAVGSTVFPYRFRWWIAAGLIFPEEELQSSHHSLKIFVESPFTYRGNIRFLNLIFKLSKTLAPVKLSNLISYCSLHIHSFQLKYIILLPKSIPCCSLCLQFSLPSIFSSEILCF